MIDRLRQYANRLQASMDAYQDAERAYIADLVAGAPPDDAASNALRQAAARALGTMLAHAGSLVDTALSVADMLDKIEATKPCHTPASEAVSRLPADAATPGSNQGNAEPAGVAPATDFTEQPDGTVAIDDVGEEWFRLRDPRTDSDESVRYVRRGQWPVSAWFMRNGQPSPDCNCFRRLVRILPAITPGTAGLMDGPEMMPLSADDKAGAQ